jgi:dienelactone hydrolase
MFLKQVLFVSLKETYFKKGYMNKTYQHLGSFSDWVAEASRQQLLYPLAQPGGETRKQVRSILGFTKDEVAKEVRLERTWQKGGIQGEEVSWSVGYGPRTHAYLLKPAGVTEKLPGIIALHDHGGFKFYGKEKIADGPEEVKNVLVSYRDNAYGGRAFANALAKEGFVVIVPDTFLWGSRKFPLEAMPEWILQTVDATEHLWKDDSTPLEIARYNQACYFHEFMIEKYCALLGTTLAGVISHEDRIAVNYLRSRADVLSDKIACIGLSGGGNRAALLQATCETIKAAVIVGLMTTYEGVLDHNVTSHTWMLFPHGWARHGDWSDLAASRAPSPLLVQYDLEDELFTKEGMQAAHERITLHYKNAGKPENYRGEFYPGPHKFDLEMQAAAFAWLKRYLF